MAVSLSDSPPSQGPSCPVCFRDYSDNETSLIPRILQCGHTYCSECLDKLLNTEPDEDEYQQVVLNIRYAGREWTTTRNYPRSPHATNELKCPTCKSMNPIQNRDISTLTKNFALLGCRSQATGLPNRNKHFCKDHDHEKRIYCDDCKTLICAYCQLYGEHKGHSFMVAAEASKPSIDSLRTSEKSLAKDLSNLTLGENALNHTISKLMKTRSKCETSVKLYFEDAIAKLDNQKVSLLSQISSWADEQMYILKAQLDMLTSSTKEVKSIQSNCQSLIEGDPLDALTEQQMVEEEVVKLREQIRDISLQPLINPWMRAKEEGPCDETLNALVDNFKLTYDADTIGGNREMSEGGLAPDDQSVNDSDSSVDSLLGGRMGGSMGLSSVLEVYRLRSLENRRALRNSGRRDDALATSSEQVYSQETQRLASNFTQMEDVVGLQDSEHPPGHDLNWLSNPPSSSFSLLNQRPQHMRSARVNINQLILEEDSGSNSDPDNLPALQNPPNYSRYLPTPNTTTRRRRLRLGASDIDHEERRMDVSTDDSDHELEEILEQHRSCVGTGVESVLDSLEIRRHWDFLNSGGGSGHGGASGGASDAHGHEDSSREEEEEEEDTTDLSFHTMVSLPYHNEGRSAHSSSSSSSPPRRGHDPQGARAGNPSSDFAFPHHLSLPVDSLDPGAEVVFATTPQYWTDQLNGRGRALLNAEVMQLAMLPTPTLDRDEEAEEDGGMDQDVPGT